MRQLILAMVWLVIPIETMGQQCCQPDIQIGKSICIDGRNLTLNCPNESYLLTTADGDLALDNDTLYVLTDKGNHSVPKDRFCIGVDQTNATIAIVCFDDESSHYEKSNYMNIYSICLLISDLFLVITLIIYCAFPPLRDLQGKSVMSFTGCLCLGYFLLAVMQQEYFGYTLSPASCQLMGFILYYLLLSAFFWLSVISFNIWKSATWQTSWNDSQLEIAYNLIGFGFSAIFVIAAYLAHRTPGNHIKPDFSSTCWFSGKSETWAFFYGPIGILLTLNMVFFTLTVIRLWKDYKDSSPVTRIQVLRFKCLLYLKLFLTMGLSWIFEIISYIFQLNIWYVTDIVNCLQGVIIFLVMVATRRRVLRLLINSGIFGDYVHKNWQTIDDEESINDEQAEQIQLS